MEPPKPREGPTPNQPTIANDAGLYPTDVGMIDACMGEHDEPVMLLALQMEEE